MTLTLDIRSEARRVAQEIRLRLSDPDHAPTDEIGVAYLQGALVAIEHVLGEPPTTDDGPAAALFAELSADASPTAHTKD